MALGKSWRSFKSRLKKKYFDEDLSAEQNLRRRPTPPDERVLPEQWKFFVNHWCSESAKKISKNNTEHRSRKKMQHITGKRSFAQIIESEKKKASNNGDTESNEMYDDVTIEDEMDLEISRVDLFAKCYTHDGNTSNPDVAEALEKMRNLQSQLPPGVDDKGPNGIDAQVTGEDKCGRVRMYGYGAMASEVYGDRSCRVGSYHMNMTYKTEIQKMKQRLDVQDKQIQELLKMNKEMA